MTGAGDQKPVAACPSARFYDFRPRVFAQVMAREDVHSFYELLNESVWDCSQCFSCTRCPRQNNPGGIITIMREVAVNHGMQSAKDALKAYSRIVDDMLAKHAKQPPQGGVGGNPRIYFQFLDGHGDPNVAQAYKDAVEALYAVAYKVKFAADVYDWSTNGYVTPREAKRLDRFTQFALVAAIDAIIDLTGAAIGLQLLGIDKLLCSPLPLSRGMSRCAHGASPRAVGVCDVATNVSR